MTRDSTGPDQQRNRQGPEALAASLSRLYAPEVTVPAEVDQRVSAAARQHFSMVRRRLTFTYRIAPWAAVAATIALLFVLNNVSPRHDATLAGDIDHNGRVDIVDAFTIARHLDNKMPANSRWDINQDGSIDLDDADAIAYEAVSLTGPYRGTRS